MDAREPAFFAGASLALLDASLRENPPFAGALRQRLALRAAAACVKMARLREDAAALRDAEHLAPGRRRPASPGAFIACGACSRPAQRRSMRRPCEPRPTLLD